MNEERVADALHILHSEGLRLRVEADCVTLRVGSLDVIAPYAGSAGRYNHKNTVIKLDGVEIQRRLRAIDVRLAVNEVNSAQLHLDLVV